MKFIPQHQQGYGKRDELSCWITRPNAIYAPKFRQYHKKQKHKNEGVRNGNHKRTHRALNALKKGGYAHIKAYEYVA